VAYKLYSYSESEESDDDFDDEMEDIFQKRENQERVPTTNYYW
jgi:hypothetical protein